jgi:hypothetical protein
VGSYSNFSQSCCRYPIVRPWSPKVAATRARFLLRFLFGVSTDPGPGEDVCEELTIFCASS